MPYRVGDPKLCPIPYFVYQPHGARNYSNIMLEAPSYLMFNGSMTDQSKIVPHPVEFEIFRNTITTDVWSRLVCEWNDKADSISKIYRVEEDQIMPNYNYNSMTHYTYGFDINPRLSNGDRVYVIPEDKFDYILDVRSNGYKLEHRGKKLKKMIYSDDELVRANFKVNPLYGRAYGSVYDDRIPMRWKMVSTPWRSCAFPLKNHPGEWIYLQMEKSSDDFRSDYVYIFGREIDMINWEHAVALSLNSNSYKTNSEANLILEIGDKYILDTVVAALKQIPGLTLPDYNIMTMYEE